MKICPALGDLEDDELQYAYPSDENHCHKAEPVGPVNLVYQSSVCLSENYRRCPVFRGRLSGPLPEGFRAEGQVSGGLELRKILLWAGLMLVALLGLGLNIAFPDLAAAVLSNSNAPPAVTQPAGPADPTETAAPGISLPVVPQATGAPDAEKTSSAIGTAGVSSSTQEPVLSDASTLPVSTATALPTASPLAASSTVASSTATSLPTASCKPPAGWVAYTVQAGDSLFYLASSTGVTVQAIKSANCLTSNLIVTGQLLYLPSLPPNPPPPALPTATMPSARATDDLPTRSP